MEHQASVDLPASIKVLRTNDNLLHSKIETLPQGTKYKNIIVGYFSSVENRHDLAVQDERTKQVTGVLRTLWVIENNKQETYSIIENFEKIEGLLFRVDGYRGHYVHQFNVFALGYYILNTLERGNNAVKEIFQQSSDPNFTWMLAATFHDMGYPIETIGELLKIIIRDFLRVDVPYEVEIEKILTPAFFEYTKYIAAMHVALPNSIGYPRAVVSIEQSTRIDWGFYNKLLMYLKRKDHGVISALLLMHSLLTQEKFYHGDTWFFSVLPDKIMPACHAISMHNLELKELSFREYPYAFLLKLCDELQDWGRSIGEKDASELIDIEISSIDTIPLLDFTLRINDIAKKKDLQRLQSTLYTDSLIKIHIKDEIGNVIFEC